MGSASRDVGVVYWVTEDMHEQELWAVIEELDQELDQEFDFGVLEEDHSVEEFLEFYRLTDGMESIEAVSQERDLNRSISEVQKGIAESFLSLEDSLREFIELEEKQSELLVYEDADVVTDDLDRMAEIVSIGLAQEAIVEDIEEIVRERRDLFKEWEELSEERQRFRRLDSIAYEAYANFALENPDLVIDMVQTGVMILQAKWMFLDSDGGDGSEEDLGDVVEALERIEKHLDDADVAGEVQTYSEEEVEQQELTEFLGGIQEDDE